MMITFVCWKWQQPGYRSKFTAEHVNRLQHMLARHCSLKHELLCVTDDAAGIEAPTRWIPIGTAHSQLANQSWPNGPSCYRRLQMFCQGMADYATYRYIVSIDLDIVIVGCINAMLERMVFGLSEARYSPSYKNLYMWGTGEKRIPLCASLVGFRADGSLSHIWDNFQGITDAREANQIMPGSDQAVIAHALGIENIAQWTQADGVYSFGHDLCYDNPRLLRMHKVPVKPPMNAKIVIFNGKPDPWECLHLPWVKEQYL